MFLLLFLFPLVDSRWTKPNIYVWLEQNSYICYLELRSPHDLRFLNKEEASILKCSCGDPLLTQSACARSNNLRRPFCSRLPDLCMKAYSTIFKPSNTRKTENQNSSISVVVNGKEVSQNEVLDYTAGTGASKAFEFFTLAPKIETSTGHSNPWTKEDEQSTKSATPSRLFSPIKQIRGFSSTTRTTSSPTTTLPRDQTFAPSKPRLLDGEVTIPRDHHGIEILFNSSHTMNSLMDSLIRRITESVKHPNSTLPHKEEKKRQEKHMIKMMSSHEEEAPIQRVVFTETMRDENSTGKDEMATNEPLVLRPHGAVPAETTSPLGDVTETPAPPASTTPNPVKVIRTKNPNKKRPIFHEALVKLQKQLLATLGVKPDDWDDEDEINDNDIITIFREHMDDENEKDLAFSDDKWSEEGEQEILKTLPFDPRVCEDNHSFCSVWTAYRLCHSHARFMYKYCRKSCGICL